MSFFCLFLKKITYFVYTVAYDLLYYVFFLFILDNLYDNLKKTKNKNIINCYYYYIINIINHMLLYIQSMLFFLKKDKKKTFSPLFLVFFKLSYKLSKIKRKNTI
jgi:hypothetical protein